MVRAPRGGDGARMLAKRSLAVHGAGGGSVGASRPGGSTLPDRVAPAWIGGNMSARPLVVLALSLAVAVAAHAQGGAPAAPAVGDPGWPRTFSRDGSTVVLHQPQVDRWDDQVSLHFRMAVEVTPAGATAPQYGVATVTADTHLDSSSNTVLLSGMVVDLSFPGMPDAQATALKALVTELVPSMTHLSISLD